MVCTVLNMMMSMTMSNLAEEDADVNYGWNTDAQCALHAASARVCFDRKIMLGFCNSPICSPADHIESWDMCESCRCG